MHLDSTGLYQNETIKRLVSSGKKGNIFELGTGSHSDHPKIKAEVLQALDNAGVAVFGSIASIHRAEDIARALTAAYPRLRLPGELEGAIDVSKLSVIANLGAAGGAAHLGPMKASKTNKPTITLPIESSMGILPAIMSGLDMPPRVPNGLVPNNTAATEVTKKLMTLNLGLSDNTISVADDFDMSLLNDVQSLIDRLGIKIEKGGNSPIRIGISDLVSESQVSIDPDLLNILIPTVPDSTDAVDIPRLIFERVNQNAAYMGSNRESKINITNAIIFAAQVLGMGNPTIKAKLDSFRLDSGNEVRAKNELYAKEQLLTPLKRKIFDSGLWPRDKKVCLEKGYSELEDLGYELFYKGKNADLYAVPDTTPIQVLMVRSDRTSVFNIKLDLEIEGKGEIQTQISKLGAKFAEERDFPTCFTELPGNIPENLQERCQTMELCKPLSMEINGENKGLELIFRNYNTGSFYKAYNDDPDGDDGPRTDPYELKIPDGMKEWDKFEKPIFTPTTKDKDDTPIPSQLVRDKFPELINKLEKLFAEFTEFMYERGYIVVDTKVEMFIDSQGNLVLGDEIFTPESSRFIKREDFEQRKFISADKQIIRNLGKEFGWEDRLKKILEDNPQADKSLEVAHEVSNDSRRKVLEGYSDIRKAMAA